MLHWGFSPFLFCTADHSSQQHGCLHLWLWSSTTQHSATAREQHDHNGALRSVTPVHRKCPLFWLLFAGGVFGTWSCCGFGSGTTVCSTRCFAAPTCPCIYLHRNLKGIPVRVSDGNTAQPDAGECNIVGCYVCMRACMHVSPRLSSWTPGVFYTHFYNHAHRLRC